MEKLIELFGLDRDFTRAELDQAYRDLVQVWHPDRYSYNPRLQRKAEETLKEINNAYELLRERVVRSDTSTVKEEACQRNIHPQHEETYHGPNEQE